MGQLLRRWEPVRIAAATVGIAFVAIFAAFGFAATLSQPSLSSFAAAAAALLIAGAAILYAWREPGR